jgi:flagellar protein FliO/FliZ
VADPANTTAKALFAAPQAATSLPESGAGGIGQVMFSLLLVLAAIFVAAWLLRRLRAAPGRGAAQLEVVSQVALGQRERAVVLRVGTQHLLLGVAQGQVSLLQTLPEGAIGGTEAATPEGGAGSALPPSFAALLRKGLGQ